MNTVDGSEILHQLRLVYPAIFSKGFIYLRSFSRRLSSTINSYWLCFNAPKTTISRSPEKLWLTEASGRSLLHEWEARCELPATQRVGLLFQKDGDLGGTLTDVMTDVRGMLTWWGCFSIYYSKSQQKTLRTDLMMSGCFFVSPTDCTLTYRLWWFFFGTSVPVCKCRKHPVKNDSWIWQPTISLYNWRSRFHYSRFHSPSQKKSRSQNLPCSFCLKQIRNGFAVFMRDEGLFEKQLLV